MSSTRSAIRQEIGIVAGACKTGTASANGNAGGTTIVDTTNFTDSYLNANFYDGWYCIVTSGTYASQVRRVSSYTGSSGTITVADAFGGQIVSAVTFELHAYDPAELNTAINRALARMYYWTIAYPSLAADGDMEASGVTNWTASNCTATKETTYVKYGAQSLKAVNSAANGYLRTATMNGTPLDYYYCEVACLAGSATATLIAYDVSNSANIATVAYDTGGRDWKRMWLQFQLPAGCFEYQIRLQGAGAAVTIYWDTLILQKVLDRRLALPSWITENGHVAQVEWRGRGRQDVGISAGASTGVELLDEEEWQSVLPQPSIEQDRTAVTPMILQFDHGVGYEAHRAVCVRPYASLTADTGSTTAPLEWVVAGALVELVRMGILRAPGSQEGEFKNQITAWKRDWVRLCGLYQPRVRHQLKSPYDA